MNKIALGIAAALTTASAVGGGIEGIISSVSSSGYYPLTPPENAFFSASNTYWLAHEAFNKAHEYFIQADLTTPYRPLSYKINVEKAQDARKVKCFELWGWPENGSAWVVLDRRVDVRWESGETEKAFYINPPENYTKLRLELQSPAGSSTYAFCINLLSFDDTKPASADVNLVRTAKLNASESPFRLGSCEVESGSADNLFDESYGVDFSGGSAQNGNWMIRKDGDGRFVTLTFSEDAFAGGTCMLTGYELSMCIGGASIVNEAQNRVPVSWRVYVSESADPGADGWMLVDTHETANWDESGFELGDYRVWHLSFSVATISVARSVKFIFDTPRLATDDFIQLGEIGLFGRIVPSQGYEILSSSINSVGQRGVSATLLILPRSDSEAGYDLFADLEHDGREESRKVLADATASGTISVDIGQLKHASDYTLRFRIVSREGIASVGDDLAFTTPDDVQADDDLSGLPDGYQALTYVESTSGGGQYVDLGFIPSGRLGFDCDLIIYNAVTKNNEWDGTTNHFGSAFGVEDGSSPLLLTTSSGGSGGFSSGLYFYNGAANHALLTPRERMQVSHRAGKYSVVCGSVTNVASIINATIPSGTTTLYAFASAGKSGPLYNSTTRFYSLRFYDETGGSLTHGFVPAKGPGDVLGLYDTVTETWCPNLGQVALVGGGLRPAGRLTAESIVFTAGRRISVCLSRKSQNATEVFAVYGSEYGGLDREAWAYERSAGPHLPLTKRVVCFRCRRFLRKLYTLGFTQQTASGRRRSTFRICRRRTPVS